MGNLIIKICAGTNKADDHHNKEFQLIHVPEFTVISFKQKPYPQMIIDHDKGGKMEVTGNVYIMNNDGKTITTFTPEIKVNTDCCIEKLGNVDIRDFDFYQDADHFFYLYSRQHNQTWVTQKRFKIECSEIAMTIDPLEDNYFGSIHCIEDIMDPLTKLSFASLDKPIYVYGDFEHHPDLSLTGIVDKTVLEFTSGFVPASGECSDRSVWASQQLGWDGCEILNPLSIFPKIHGLLF